MFRARLTLVSASPRRREILRKLDLPFDSVESNALERWSGGDGKTISRLNARAKVERSSYYGDRSRVLVGADTLIEIDGMLLGKPVNRSSARRMLEMLSARTHKVITGVALSGFCGFDNLRLSTITDCAVSRVKFKSLIPRQISDYLSSDEWSGKAGAYAIQGSAEDFVDRLTGDRQNVIGMPLELLRRLLAKHFSHCNFL